MAQARSAAARFTLASFLDRCCTKACFSGEGLSASASEKQAPVAPDHSDHWSVATSRLHGLRPPGIAIDVTYVDRERSSGRWILETITSEERDLYSLAVVSATDGWTVGIGGRVYHYDGASWTLHTTTVEGSTLDSIAMVSATDGWIVGWGGRIYRTIP